MPGERILIVDDEPDIIILLKAILEKETFRSYVANNGKEAIELAKTLLPDLILLDILMPKVDGYEVCRRLRDNFHTSHIPIIILTARDAPIDKVKGLKLGADDYVTKPFNHDELLARIKAVLRRTHLERDCNPLTQLPGNIAIEYQIRDRLKLGLPFAFMYADLDNFKAFNDYYGYNRGDVAIKLLANIILIAVKKYGSANDFIGHIGGDDFIIITKKVESMEDICKDIIDGLKTSSPELFEQKDRKKGYFETIDRRGNKKRFSAQLNLTIAVTSNQHVNFSNSLQISDTLAEIKRYGKQMEGSVFVVDRRGEKKINKPSDVSVSKQ
ncbi:MAG: response regulator [bacterium]|nr:response regulator [bacterium]